MPNKPIKKQRPWVQERKPFGRREDNSKFYNSRKWRKVSKRYRDANPLCECSECKRLKRIRPSEAVDHIRGLQFLLDNNLDPFDESELQSMSFKCHNKKSGRDAHKIKGDGSENKF